MANEEHPSDPMHRTPSIDDFYTGPWNPSPEWRRELERKWAIKYGEEGWYPNAINPATGLPRSREEENPLEE